MTPASASSWNGSRQLSGGTLRFICLSTLLLQPPQLQPSTILIDEPELGLHPYALAVIADLLRRASEERQLIVSTQSVEPVDRLSPQDVIVVHRKDGESIFEPLDEACSVDIDSCPANPCSVSWRMNRFSRAVMETRSSSACTSAAIRLLVSREWLSDSLTLNRLTSLI